MAPQLLSTLLFIASYAVSYFYSSGRLGGNITKLYETFPFPHLPASRIYMVAGGIIVFLLAIRIVWGWTIGGQNSPTNKQITPRFWIISVLHIFCWYALAQHLYTIATLLAIGTMIVLWQIIRIIGATTSPLSGWTKKVRKAAFGSYAGWITTMTILFGSSQLVATFVDKQFALTTTRARWSIVLTILVSGRVFRKYRNRAQGVMTLFVLIGVLNSLI